MQQSTATMTTTAGQGGAAITSTTHQMQSGTTCCMMPPPVLFLFFTLLMTSSATAMLCAAIMTDHWEHVSWNREQLDKLGNKSSIDLQWYLDGRAAKFSVSDMHRKTGDARNKAFDLPRHNSIKNNNAPFDERANVFLVPMNGGIWTLCVDLTAEEIRSLSIDGFPQVNQCVNYLAGNTDSAQTNEENNARAEWQHRMQNLSISCSLVCLIILGSAALVGAFGVCQRQISAVLVTGVMYLLAALFALFTLMIIHFKRQQGRPIPDITDYGVSIDGVVAIKPDFMYAQPLLDARVIVTAWSLDLGWGGVVLCAFTSFLWILLSKIMRFNPLSAMI
ncbi:uncharacterized protein LOC129775910 isoform X2 [Toxorhynchites rutilus septentrionalis]|uniref:uncharacterized protein LOC129775910 isoform X2 n=1 Tax=Toxorhynchites rutilus septentrionalis TaxID=329112 RepID=UPI002478A299|nr:uncharacterized protein LOC129775910 isoform X2 [Toxorhynchites rutilus septentrionalis]